MAVGVALTAMPRALRAQPRKSARIGWVGSWYSQSVGALLFDSFRQGMRALGYVEGQNLTIKARWLEGTASPHEEAAKATAELGRSKVDVLVAQGTTIPGVKGAAGSTPVVFVYSGDPVEAKLVASLARPGGNLTGMTVFDVELGGKQLELLKEAIPRLSRVGVLANPLHIGEYPELQRSQSVAQRLGLRLQQALVRTIPEVNAALESMRRERVQALMVFPNLLTLSQRHVIADVAANHRIPTISGWEDFAIDGNVLMTCGPSLREAWRYVATYVDKILKGARPADLPVEQPAGCTSSSISRRRRPWASLFQLPFWPERIEFVSDGRQGVELKIQILDRASVVASRRPGHIRRYVKAFSIRDQRHRTDARPESEIGRRTSRFTCRRASLPSVARSAAGERQRWATRKRVAEVPCILSGVQRRSQP